MFKEYRIMKFLILIIAAILSMDAMAQTPNHLQGKSINVIGDSYVRNHRRPYTEAWHSLVAERNGMTYRNYGRNGGCIVFDREDEGFGKSMLERYKEMNDTADYVLVIAGHNDADKIKQSADSLQMFREGLGEFCQALIAKYPTAKIAFVTPWKVPRPGFDETIQVITDVCAQYSIPCFNAAAESGVRVYDPAFRAAYFQDPNDTAHLNAQGHEWFYPRALQFIMGL